MRKNNLEIKEANARELHMIEYLAGLDCQLANGQEVLRDRLKLVPNGWRDFRLAVTRIEKVIDGVYDTLPAKTISHMNKLLQYGQIIIRPKPMIKMAADAQIIETEDLRLLINTAISAECALCLKDAREQKKCKLRRCLNNIAPTEAVREDGLCSYTDVVIGNEYGKYI